MIKSLQIPFLHSCNSEKPWNFFATPFSPSILQHQLASLGSTLGHASDSPIWARKHPSSLCFLSCLRKKRLNFLVHPSRPLLRIPRPGPALEVAHTHVVDMGGGEGEDTPLLGIKNVALDTYSFPIQIEQYIMRLVILDDYDKLSEWAAKYVRNRILKFNPGPDKYFVLGLPTGKY